MQLVFSIFVLLIGGPCISRVQSLECYSCDTDITDLDCNDIKSLQKEVCSAVSDSQLLSSSCGYMRVKDGNNTERISRGCIVAGECQLLEKQSELTSKYQMATCQECRTDLCNDATVRSSSAVLKPGLAIAIVVFYLF